MSACGTVMPQLWRDSRANQYDRDGEFLDATHQFRSEDPGSVVIDQALAAPLARHRAAEIAAAYAAYAVTRWTSPTSGETSLPSGRLRVRGEPPPARGEIWHCGSQRGAPLTGVNTRCQPGQNVPAEPGSGTPWADPRSPRLGACVHERGSTQLISVVSTSQWVSLALLSHLRERRRVAIRLAGP